MQYKVLMFSHASHAKVNKLQRAWFVCLESDLSCWRALKRLTSTAILSKQGIYWASVKIDFYQICVQIFNDCLIYLKLIKTWVFDETMEFNIKNQEAKFDTYTSKLKLRYKRIYQVWYFSNRKRNHQFTFLHNLIPTLKKIRL